jgi:hypothetical protein
VLVAFDLLYERHLLDVVPVLLFCRFPSKSTHLIHRTANERHQDRRLGEPEHQSMQFMAN